MNRTLQIVTVLALVGAVTPAFARGNGGPGHSMPQMSANNRSALTHRDRDEGKMDRKRTPNPAALNKALTLVIGTWPAVARTYLADLKSGNKAGAAHALRQLRELSMIGNKFNFSVGANIVAINGHAFALGAMEHGQVSIDGKIVRT